MRTPLAALLAVVLLPEIFGYNILGIFPTLSRSHYISGGALMKGLAAAGHNVTVISPFPQTKAIPNFRDYEILGIVEALTGGNRSMLDLHKVNSFVRLKNIHNTSLFTTKFTLTHPRMTAFLADPSEHFDVVICEIFANDALLGLGQHFGAPIIGFTSFGSSMWSNDLVGTPAPLSYVPHLYLNNSDRMTFMQRVANTLMTIYQRLIYEQFLTQQQNIYEKAFPGVNKPTLKEIRQNVSLVLVNQHFTTGYPQPYVPNMIEVGGMHINRDAPNPLPDDIRDFIEDAPHGVVYFSMGANIRSVQLPNEIRDALLRTFGKLRERVLWKWEILDLPGKPNNVMISKWFPQDDILAHPNVKVFITHGGLLSMTEAVYHGLPIIGIPVFGDQFINMVRAENSGYGLTVAYRNLSEHSMDWALSELLNNRKYSIAAQTISKRYRDQPIPPLEVAKFWVEYVVRHNGAPHMHSAGQDLHFTIYHSIDVFGFIATSIGIAAYLGYWLIKQIIGFVLKVSSVRAKIKLIKKRK